MNLEESQKKIVSDWIQAGLKLSEIQNRLASELGLRMTYMDVRLLVDDLKLTPKDVDPPKPPPAPIAAPATKPSPLAPTPAATPAPARAEIPAAEPSFPEEPAPALGSVSVSVDQIARAGAVVSGKVTFSDGKKATWYLDQMGRLGLGAEQPGYRPSQADLQQFQMALEGELSKMGY